MQQQSQIPDPRAVEAEKITDSRDTPQPSTILNPANFPPANHTLKTRIGGWIANFFSWYRY